MMSVNFYNDVKALSCVLASFLEKSSGRDFKSAQFLVRDCLVQWLSAHRQNSVEIDAILKLNEEDRPLSREELIQIYESLLEAGEKLKQAENRAPISWVPQDMYSINASNWRRLRYGLQSVLKRTKDPELSSLIGEGGLMDERLSDLVEKSLIDKKKIPLLQWHGKDISINCELAQDVLRIFQQLWILVLDQTELKVSHGDVHLVILDHGDKKTVDIYLKDFPWSHHLDQLTSLSNNASNVMVFLHEWKHRPLLRMQIPHQHGREKILCCTIGSQKYAVSLNDYQFISVGNCFSGNRLELPNGEVRRDVELLTFDSQDGLWKNRPTQEAELGLWTGGKIAFKIDDAHGVLWSGRESVTFGRQLACTSDGQRLPFITLKNPLKKIA